MKVILSSFNGYLQVVSEKKGRSKKQNINGYKKLKERILFYMIKLLDWMGLFIKILFLRISFTVNQILMQDYSFLFSPLKLQGFIDLLVYSK